MPVFHKTQIRPTSFTIGHNVVRREQVDEVIEQAHQAGADIVKPPQDTFYGGCGGLSSDPNGHLWEVVWNPANLRLIDFQKGFSALFGACKFTSASSRGHEGQGEEQMHNQK